MHHIHSTVNLSKFDTMRYDNSLIAEVLRIKEELHIEHHNHIGREYIFRPTGKRYRVHFIGIKTFYMEDKNGHIRAFNENDFKINFIPAA